MRHPPSTATPHGEPSVSSTSDPRLVVEQLRLLHINLPSAYLGSLAVSFLTAGALWHHVPPTLLGAWLAYQLAVTGIRFGHGRHRRLAVMPAGDEHGDTRKVYVGVLFAGLGWGAMAGFLPILAAPEYGALIAMSAAGITAGSAPLYAVFLPLARSFLVLVLVPLVLAFFVLGDHLNVVMGTAILAYLLIMLRSSANLHQWLIEGLASRFHRSDIDDELRRAREKAEKLNADLRQKVTQLEATQQDLVTAKDQAESAAVAKSLFLANMSHEIRTPMNGVLGMAELLHGTRLSQRQVQLVDSIRRAGTQLLGVINDVLDFSKIDAGKLEIMHVPFDLRELIEELGELFASTAHEKAIALVLDIPAECPATYRGDPVRLRQVLTNLVSNALKFTERGEVVISVRQRTAPAGGVLLAFDVRDSGIGIREEHQVRIFDSFTQADGSTTRKFGGTGLGLALCRQLTALMGGEIGIESTFGHGARFWFTCQVEVCAPSEVPGAAAGHEALTPVVGMKVLVVGPADTARDLLVAQLRAWGAAVDCAQSGTHALDELARAMRCGVPYEVMLFPREITAPKAFEFAQAIRANAQLNDLRIIMLTSVANLEATGDILTNGVNAYLTRPVRQRELHTVLTGGARTIEARDNGTEANRAGFSARVLVVEDNPVNQELALSMLEALGCNVRVASNGQEAVEAITASPLDTMREPVDTVLMDCQMPVLDGYAATRAIRTWERERGEARVPIVALTANALEGDREQCLEAGMDDYLAKPFTSDALRRVLARWLPLAVPVDTRDESDPPAAAKSADRANHVSMLNESTLARIAALQRPGNRDLLGHLIGLFLANAARLINEVDAGVAEGDANRVRIAVHTLKSSSANLGAVNLAKLAAELEASARAGSINDISTRLDILHFELDGVIAALRALRPSAAA